MSQRGRIFSDEWDKPIFSRDECADSSDEEVGKPKCAAHESEDSSDEEMVPKKCAAHESEDSSEEEIPEKQGGSNKVAGKRKRWSFSDDEASEEEIFSSDVRAADAPFLRMPEIQSGNVSDHLMRSCPLKTSLIKNSSIRLPSLTPKPSSASCHKSVEVCVGDCDDDEHGESRRDEFESQQPCHPAGASARLEGHVVDDFCRVCGCILVKVRTLSITLDARTSNPADFRNL